MSAASVLKLVLEALAAADVPHMLVGSFASSTHGAPRTTHDIDLVIDPTHDALDLFVDALGTEVYVGPSPHEALELRDQFNVVDPVSGWKVDLIIRKDTDFARSEFGRRIAGTLMGSDIWLATAEDTVLAKLAWAAASGSDRQLVDASTVLAVRGDEIDDEYLDRWAGELGVVELLGQVRGS